jgi:hypothetical protein
VFSHDGDRCLWLLELDGSDRQPRRLSPPGAYGGGLIDAGRDRWIGVRESGSDEGAGCDQLVAVGLEGGEPQPLLVPADSLRRCAAPAPPTDPMAPEDAMSAAARSWPSTR